MGRHLCRLRGLRPGGRRNFRRRRRYRRLHEHPQLRGLRAGAQLRQRRTETDLAGGPGQRKGHRLLLPDRTPGRFRSAQPAHPRRTARRPVGDQRRQAVRQQWQARQAGDCVCRDRSGPGQTWHLGVPGTDRHCRFYRGSHRTQDGHPRFRHLRGDPEQLHHPRSQSARRARKRPGHRPVQPRRRPHRHRRASAGHRPRRVRSGTGLFP
ncbi:hypothetical protein D3C87_1121960 [compost metagenome]